MKKFMLQYLPNTAIIMAFCLFFTSLLNLVTQPELSLSSMFIVQISVYILGTQIFLDVLDLIPFNSHKTYLCFYYASIFCFFLLVSYVMNWFPFTLKWLLTESIFFIFICFLLHLYFGYKERKQADEINQLIKK